MGENMTEFMARSCPVCRTGISAFPPEVSSLRKAEDLEFEELRQFWTGFFKEKVFFSYYRCAKCGLLFCPAYFDPKQLEELYSRMVDNTAGLPISVLRRTQNGYFKTLKSHADLSGAYLEVGPDIGLFTDYCAREGDFSDFWLFEPNRAVHDTLRKTVMGKACHLINEMFSYDSLPDDHINVAVMIHVLDHLIDPVKTLVELKRTLKNGATLMLVTHDDSSLLARLSGARWPAFCLHHPEVYNPDSITNLLNVSGYNVIQITKTRNVFPASHLLQHLLWAMGMKIEISDKLNLFNLSLKLGNIITLASPVKI